MHVTLTRACLFTLAARGRRPTSAKHCSLPTCTSRQQSASSREVLQPQSSPTSHTSSHVYLWRSSAPPFSRFLQALTSCCTQKLVCWICPTSPSAKTTVRHSQSLPCLTQLKLRHAISLRYLPEKDNSRCQSQRTNSRCRNRMSR